MKKEFKFDVLRGDNMDKQERKTIRLKPITKVLVPDKSKFKGWEDVLDYLIALGISVKVGDEININGVDLEIIEKYSKLSEEE